MHTTARAAGFVAVAFAGVVATSTAVAAPKAVPAEKTAAAVTDPSWKAPRTSWGDPDLSGIWTSDDMHSVPRERPQKYGTHEELPAADFAARAAADDKDRNHILNEAAFSSRSVGTRTFGYTSQVIDPPDGRMPDMTEAGLSRAAPRDRGTFGPGPFDSFDDFTLYDRCITRGLVGSILPVVYGNGLRIVQNPDSVAISYEMIHETRVVKLDGSPFPSGAIREYLGESRGHWEGDTLVVETRNLTDKTSIGGNGNGIRHSEAMKITERLTRVDPSMIEYEVTVNDPVTYEAPFTMRLMLTSQPGYRIYEYACHEGNQAVANALRGARAYEKNVAEAKAKGLPIPNPVPYRQYDKLYLPKDSSAFSDINSGQ